MKQYCYLVSDSTYAYYDTYELIEHRTRTTCCVRRVYDKTTFATSTKNIIHIKRDKFTGKTVVTTSFEILSIVAPLVVGQDSHVHTYITDNGRHLLAGEILTSLCGV